MRSGLSQFEKTIRLDRRRRRSRRFMTRLSMVDSRLGRFAVRPKFRTRSSLRVNSI